MHQLVSTLLIAGGLLCPAIPASADDFVVASNGDEGDANPGNGFCATPGLFGSCTFRAAVEEANALPGEDRIFLGTGTITIAFPGIVVDDDVIIEGVGAYQTILQSDGGGAHRGLLVGEGVEMFLGDLALRGFTQGPTTEDGGGVKSTNADITLARVWIDSNSARSCGGVWVQGGRAQIRDSTFTHNTAAGSGLNGGRGGGLCVSHGADVTVSNSTLFGNSALEGGALRLRGAVSALEITSSTLVDNVDRYPATSPGGFDDSAIYYGSGALQMDKLLIVGTCRLLALPATNGGNLQSPGDNCILGAAGDQWNVTRQQVALGPVDDYGGPVPTMLPGSASFAVDPPLSFTVCSSFDARGEPRVSHCDVGAVERQLDDPEVATIFEDGFETGNTAAWSATHAP